MTISSEFLEIIQKISKRITLPSIQDVFFPKITNKNDLTSKKTNFGAIRLTDGSIGVVYLGLSPEVKELGSNMDKFEYIKNGQVFFRIFLLNFYM